MTQRYDVVVIGGGPAGMAAAIAAKREGASVLLLEREARLGGILKQCIHDGFGLIRYGEKLSGPEYALRDIRELERTGAYILTQTFVTRIEPVSGAFRLTLVSRSGISTIVSKSLVLATGCRERTAKQVFIHGTRPAGVITAGSAQYYTNILGQLPGRRCVILGSGDIGLIMARRLTLEGAEVLGVYEAKQTPGGLLRNIVQCLHDFDIPLHLKHTVTRVFGHHRVEAVEVSRVDESMRPVAGTEQIIPCDTLVLSVGLIPENELAESLNIELCGGTNGPLCDQHFMTEVQGVFCCGNAAHVNDLVDYVSESGFAAGRGAARYAAGGDTRAFAAVEAGPDFLYAFPQRVDIKNAHENLTLFFRTKDDRRNATVRILVNGTAAFQKKYARLVPPEMQRLEADVSGLSAGGTVRLEMEDAT